MASWADLDAHSLLRVMLVSDARDVMRAATASRCLRGAAADPALWEAKLRSMEHGVRALLPQMADRRGAYIRAQMLDSLEFAAWERLHPLVSRDTARPCPREGHAAASWGSDSLILFGGWGSGIRNDLYILQRTRPSQPPAAHDCAAAAHSSVEGGEASARPGGSSSGAGGDAPSTSASHPTAPAAPTRPPPGSSAPWLAPCDEPCSWRWRVPRVAGRLPAIRYGHSATRCGAQGELLVVLGGMQGGGYTAEISSLAVLRPYSGSAGAEGRSTAPHDRGAAAAAAASTAALPSSSSSRGGGAGGYEYRHEHDSDGVYEYEWWHPQLSGADPVARGYHAACASEDGLRLYVFGGISRRQSIAAFTVIDLTTWRVERPATTGPAPDPRFGCSLVAHEGKLWVVGGGYGSDLARSGHDLADVFTLDLATWEWSKPATANRPHREGVLGRCHASALVGCKLVLFGGSLDLGNEVTTLDLRTCTWGAPLVLGTPPGKRMSAAMVRSGSDLLVYGGWIYSSGEMGDLHRVRLVLDGEELRAARRRAAPASAGDGSGGSGATAGGSGAGGGANPHQQLGELLSTQLAHYYRLMRAAQERADGQVPMAQIREMHEVMGAIRALRAHPMFDELDDDEDDDNDEQAAEEEEAGADSGDGDFEAGEEEESEAGGG